MRETRHMCQSVRGAIKNWNEKTWKAVARDNGWTVNFTKEKFRIYEFEGKKVIPIGEACEGFSYENGCPGHQVADDPSENMKGEK